MTATPSQTLWQSLRESRLPTTMLTLSAPPLARTLIKCLVSLEGRTKQRTFWKPRDRSALTTAGPRKPVAPVTSSGSALSTMNGRCILIQIPKKDQCVRSVLERPQMFLNFVSKESKDLAGVVAILDQILHEVVVT